MMSAGKVPLFVVPVGDSAAGCTTPLAGRSDDERMRLVEGWMRLPVLGFAVLCVGCVSAPGNYVPARPSIAVTPTVAPTPWWISPGEAACPPAGAPPQRGQVVRAATETYCEADGVAHGPETRFYPDGRVAETGMLDHGVRVGPWTRFFVDGTIADYGTYTKGRPTGVWSTFYPSGREHERGQLDGEDRLGRWVAWEDRGAAVRDPDDFVDYRYGEPVMHGKFREGRAIESRPVCAVGMSYPACRFLPLLELGLREQPGEDKPVHGRRGSGTVELGGIVNLDPHHAVGLAAGWIIDATYPSSVVEARYRYWLLEPIAFEGGAGLVFARHGIGGHGWHAHVAIDLGNMLAVTTTVERRGNDLIGLLGVRFGLPTLLGAAVVLEQLK